jgi:protein SCO1/2
MRAAFLLALALLAFPPSLPAHEAGGDKRLPVIGPAPPFTLTSQDGMPVALADLRGKVVALSFIYTGCPDICPMLTQKMVDVQDALGRISAPRLPLFRSAWTRNATRRRC